MSAKAEDYVLGMNFVVTHNTTISQVGVFDGGNPLTSQETVGIFDDSTGNLIGPDLLFGPGYSGAQVGNTFYESVTPFVLTAGDYSIISIGSSPTAGGAGGSDFSSLQNLGNTLDLPGGGRFNSGADFDVGFSTGSDNQIFGLIDPPDNDAPDGGTTVLLLGGALTAMGWIRRKI